jgi:hypothetical protein
LREWKEERRESEREEEDEEGRQSISDRVREGKKNATPTSTSHHHSPPKPKNNNSSIALALTSALAAGVLGVEGWSGFLYYLAGQAVAASALWAKTAGEPEAFALSKVGLLVGESLGSTSLLTFILFWSLAHNYVHLF